MLSLKSDASDALSAEEDAMELIAEMAALGLPTTFLSRSAVQGNGGRKRPGTDSEKCEEFAEAGDEVPSVLFFVRSVNLFSSKNAVPEGLDLPQEFVQDSELDSGAVDNKCLSPDVQSVFSEPKLVHDGTEFFLSGKERYPSPNIGEAEVDVVTDGGVIWEPIWDEQYQQYYFWNHQTNESTWETPQGFEQYGPSVHWNGSSAADQDSNLDLSCANVGLTSPAEGNSGEPILKRVEAESGECPPSCLGHVESIEKHLDDGVSCTQTSNELYVSDEPMKGDVAAIYSFKWNQDNSSKQEASPGDVMVPRALCGVQSDAVEVERLEEAGCRDSEIRNPGMGELEDSCSESFPTFPPACGSHVRFDDSDGSSSGAGDEEGIDWGEVELESSDQVTLGNGQEGSEAFSPSSEEWKLKNVKRNLQPSQVGIKKRRLRSISGTGSDQFEKVLLPGMVESMSKSLVKYWLQRYSLFSKFDEGIKMDEEGWFSVTPESIAAHQALRCPAGLVVDAFCGVGGNAIQFALKNHYVIAIDIDPLRLEYARHNAEIYGVADKIEFIVGDFFRIAPFLKADFVFLSPPWGGPEYLKEDKYDIQSMLQPKDGYTLFKVAQGIAPNVVLFLPRNVELVQLQELSWLFNPPIPCEVEKNFVDHKLKAITVYYGEIAGQEGIYEL